MHCIEQFHILSNFYFQGDSEVIQEQEGAGVTATVTGGPQKALQKKYKCRIQGCTHPAFKTRHSLATHLKVYHKKQGSKCCICSKIMSKYHLAGHLDKHTLSQRHFCKEQIGKVNCNKSYQQKSALICHLLEKCYKSSQKTANVFIKGERDVAYELAKEYKYVAGSIQEKAEMINQLVESYGEEIYEQLNFMFSRVQEGLKMFKGRNFWRTHVC